jgi:hypothetical protein
MFTGCVPGFIALVAVGCFFVFILKKGAESQRLTQVADSVRAVQQRARNDSLGGRDDSMGAYFFCQRAVKDSLEASGTVDFPSHSSQVTTRAPQQHYLVHAVANFQAGGTQRRAEFACHVHERQLNDWQLDDLQVLRH